MARRLYVDTSAYLCVLLGEDASAEPARELRGASLRSSVLLVLEPCRNLIRLARARVPAPRDLPACLERVEADREHVVLRDLTLDLRQGRVMPIVSTPHGVDLAHRRTALRLREREPLARFVTLDVAQEQAARELGLCVDAVRWLPTSCGLSPRAGECAARPMCPSADPLADLTEAQREAVLWGDGPLLVVAGPGSGKTRVITRRLAHLVGVRGVAPEAVLAITFTNKAAEEMSRRVAQLCDAKGAWVRTFHSTCAAILRRWPESAGLRSGFTIFDTSDQSRVVRAALRDLGAEGGGLKPAAAIGAISNWKCEGVTPADALAGAHTPERRTGARVYEAYERQLAESNAVDFDDLLVRTLRAMREDLGLRRWLQERFEHVLIDEYQDTSPVQFQLARMWAARTRNICAVGDPDQSIYAFRKADLRNILEFEEQYPGAKVVRLERNFRSVQSVLRAADALISHNRERYSKRLVAESEDGPPVRVVSAWTEREEGLAVADAILAAYGRGVAYRDIAVFYRVNAQSRALEAGLRSRGIPYTIVKGIEFYERAEIKDLLAYLKAIANPRDRESLARVLATPPKGIGAATIERLRGLAREHGWTMREAVRRAADLGEFAPRIAGALRATAEALDDLERRASGSVAALLDEVVRRTEFKRYLQAAYDEEAADRQANVEELLGAAREYDGTAGAEASLPDFLTRVGLVSDQDAYDPDAPRVALMTLHTAKGLEFREVIITGLEEGLLPHARSLDEPKDLEEERRLLFVGLTRAKERVTLTYATQRTARLAGPWSRAGESRFLWELPPEVLEHDRGAGPASVETEYGGTWGARARGETRRDTRRFEEGVDVQPDYAADEDPSHALRVGLEVEHPAFGRGRVGRLMGRCPRARAVVWFDRAGEKTLALDHAKLRPLEG